MENTKPRGTQDHIMEINPSFKVVGKMVQMLAELNGYYEIKTPIFENEQLFTRSIGPTSDIVNKEFYQFTDKGGRSMVLRPELTASICRCVVENKLLDKMSLPIKAFYLGPLFRYERPQSGRLRQFHQFGVECIGSNSLYDDVEMLVFASSILDAFNYKDYIIKINNICSFETRQKWIVALKEYFKPFVKDLTEDSVNRLEKNPLRILDDKVDGKKDFVKKAPKISAFATKEELDYFKNITTCLDQLRVKYIIDETLVRGLDYYCNFIFEIETTSSALTGQPTLIGGGRYNSLISELGGKDVGCVGFAMGIERLIVALEEKKLLDPYIERENKVDVVIANLDESTSIISLTISRMLKMAGLSSLCNFNVLKIEKHFKYAASAKAKYVIIVGHKEIKNQCVLVKDQKTMKQEEVKLDNLITYLSNKKFGGNK